MHFVFFVFQNISFLRVFLMMMMFLVVVVDDDDDDDDDDVDFDGLFFLVLVGHPIQLLLLGNW